MTCALRGVGMTQGLRTGEKQEFSWGYIEWWHTPENDGPGRMSLGKVVLYPLSQQALHNHYADEQILYGVGGSSTHLINGKEFQLEAGSWLYLPPYSTHGMVNRGREEAEFLLIAGPVSAAYVEDQGPKMAMMPEADDKDEVSLAVVRELTDRANLEEVQNKFASATGLTVSLVGPGGVLLTRPVNPPEFCRWCMAKHGNCEFLTQTGEGVTAEEVKWLRCSYGLVSVRVPVRAAGVSIMWIICGHVFVDRPESLEKTLFQLRQEGEGSPKVALWYQQVEVASRNRLIAAAELLKVTACSLSRIFVTATREKELQEYRLRWLNEQNAKMALEADLHKMRIALIEAQINPHFLFNTLNLIAESAVVEGNDVTAGLVYALSDLLRFSLKRIGHSVYLKEELDYIRNYLYIQEHRFPDNFSWIIEVPEDLSNLRVPAMLLQPLVENSFVHGLILNGKQKGFLGVKVLREKENLKIIIEDNGRGLCPGKLARIRHALDNGSYESLPGNGLRSVFWRLKHYFGEEAALRLESKMGGGTKVTLVLPGILKKTNRGIGYAALDS